LEGHPVKIIDRIEKIIEPTVNNLGFDIVRVLLSGDHNPRLQIMAEPLDGRAMNVDDCAAISRAVSALLDVEDPVSSSYTLEVSSPGLDRPLVRLQHFERFAGYEARIETAMAIDGRKRFRGRLGGIEGDSVLLQVDKTEWVFPFPDIQKAKLIVTDEMLAEAEGRK
jgi:ribosome maturation factor RimP